MLTVQEKIDTGRVCGYLASNEIAGGKRVGGEIDPRLPSLLYSVTTGLEWLYELDNANTDLELIGNYLISICRHYAKAQSILALGGGGSVSPISPITLPDPYDFIVSASSFIATGVSSISIPLFVGYNISFDRGGQPQYTTDPGDGSSFFGWNRVTGLFTISGPAFAGEQFRITPIG